ncbi:MAG: nicotianamine synthase family protein [Hyphomicrobiales bacterium]
MSDTVAPIRELCGALVFYANRLGRLRRRVEPVRADVTGATYLSADCEYATTSPWYRVIEPIYAELDTFVRRGDAAQCAEVFADSWILANEPKLHRMRACYEFDKEFDEARAILDGDDPAATLSLMVSEQAYWAMAPAVRDVLMGMRHVAVAGSGPLPLTALAIAAGTGARVTCIERDGAACRLARRLIEISGHAGMVDAVETAIADTGLLTTCDAVVGAVLLGVSHDAAPTMPKREIIDQVLSRAKPGALLVMRDPYRLGRLFYPPADVAASPGLEVERIDPETGPDQPYMSSFLFVRRTEPVEAHARSSAV